MFNPRFYHQLCIDLPNEKYLQFVRLFGELPTGQQKDVAQINEELSEIAERAITTIIQRENDTEELYVDIHPDKKEEHIRECDSPDCSIYYCREFRRDQIHKHGYG